MTSSFLANANAEKLLRSGERIVITGAGGWIGLGTLELLRNGLGAEEFHKRVYAFGSRDRTLLLRDGAPVQQQALEKIGGLAPEPTILLHTAFVTKDLAETMAEKDYIRQNERIRAVVFDALDRIGVDKLFLASSGAAGLANDPAATPSMRLYGRLKLQDEEIFSHWAREGSRPAVVARLFALSGPYINKPQTYALAAFIHDALAGRPIEVRARHRVIRGYVAIREVMSLVFAMLAADGPTLQQFETGGEAIELGKVASTIADLLGAPGVNRPSLSGSNEQRYAGDDVKYQQFLQEFGFEHIPFAQQVIETAEFLSCEPRNEEALSA